MNSKKLFFLFLIILTLPVFAQRVDLSLIPYRQGNLWGYANPDRSIAIKPMYDEANWFVSGYAVVKKGSKYGYINTNGKLVIPFKFYSAKPFRYGYFDAAGQHMEAGKMIKNQDSVLFAGAAPKPDGVEICINTKGQRMSKCPAINEATVQDNTDVLQTTSQKVYSLVNNQGLYDKIVDDY
ncbi:MAG TPA: WG repeat-containing protein, partial [Ferruginibacter sp.]|nr:WG repeat-containing protein [Ferruginibacter sp.]